MGIVGQPHCLLTSRAIHNSTHHLRPPPPPTNLPTNAQQPAGAHASLSLYIYIYITATTPVGQSSSQLPPLASFSRSPVEVVSLNARTGSHMPRLHRPHKPGDRSALSSAQPERRIPALRILSGIQVEFTSGNFMWNTQGLISHVMRPLNAPMCRRPPLLLLPLFLCRVR